MGPRVLVAVPKEEQTVYLASAEGRVIHFTIDDVNVLSGVGKGVLGIPADAVPRWPAE